MKILVIIAQEKFNNKEFLTVVDTLRKKNIDYDVASNKKLRAFGYVSLSIMPDLSIDEIIVSSYDCLIIIGGSGNKKYLWNNEVLHNKIKEAFYGNKILGAICLAPICFIYSGIVKGSSITAYKTKETINIIENSGNFYEDKDVFISNNIITANGPKASQKFIDAVLSVLK